jgi:hypothetical protein
MAIRFDKVKKTLEADDSITFGKYAGLTLGKVILLDPEYLDWAVKQPNLLCISDSVAKEIRKAKTKVIADKVLDIQRKVALNHELDSEDVPF